MKAICLLAGRSSRLLPLTKEVHKSALQVARWPILDWQMATFKRAGVDEVIAVVGHGRNESRRLLERWSELLNVTVIDNADYDRRNLDFSLFCARQYLEGSVLYFEGDLLLHPDLITAMSRANSEIVIAASGKQNSQCVDTLVCRDGESFWLQFAEHGSIDISDSEGEFICAARISEEATSLLRAELALCDFVGPMRLYEIFSDLMCRRSTALVDASIYPWIEIDRVEDLERATSIVESFGFQPPVCP